MSISVKTARRCYAEELRFSAHVESRSVVDAFATVPRERFVGPGPWQIKSPMRMGGYWTTPDADPRNVYHDTLIALDAERGINNGRPSLWIALLDELGIASGEHVIHLGCGTGYYSAVAELVGTTGTVTAIEIDAQLAARARKALLRWEQVSVLNTDGSSVALDPADTIITSVGATHPLPAWLDALRPNGRLLMPMTADDQWGGMLLVTRRQSRKYAARFVCSAGFIEFSGTRDAVVAKRLATVFRRDRGLSVKSLRRAPAEPDETCWLAGEGWWLSTAGLED